MNTGLPDDFTLFRRESVSQRLRTGRREVTAWRGFGAGNAACGKVLGKL
jgi:hypothetical protein